MSEMNRRSFLVSAVTAAAVISLPVLQSFAEVPMAATDTPIDAGPVKAFSKDGVTDTWAKKNKFFVVRQVVTGENTAGGHDVVVESVVICQGHGT